MTIPANARFRRNEDTIFQWVDAEAIMLSVDQGYFYEFNRTGARIWELLASERSVAELVALLAAEFDVDAATCEADLGGIIERLIAEGVVYRHDG